MHLSARHGAQLRSGAAMALTLAWTACGLETGGLHREGSGMDGGRLDAETRDAGPSLCGVCNDGDPCNGTEVCSGARCVPGVPPVCDDLVACTVDACDRAMGCTHMPTASLCTASTGGMCDVGTGCQYPECTPTTCMAEPCVTAACVSGACVRTPQCGVGQECCASACASIGCDDLNPCTADACGAGGCMNIPNHALCDDDNPCTDDVCGPSGCENRANANACDDGNPCTMLDTCAGGACVGTGMCDDGNPCTDDLCAPGGCMNVNNTSPCNDSNVCTRGDRCSGGACRPGGDPCPPVGGCGTTCFVNPMRMAECRYVTGDTCDDGLRCTTSDLCTTRGCRGTDTCTGGKHCTASGCVH